MKNIILSVLISLLTVVNGLSQDKCLTDTTYNYKFISGTSIKELTGIEINTYDNDHNKTEQLLQSWVANTNSWVNVNKHNYSYDGNNNQIEELFSTWNTPSNSWVNNYKFNNVYDGNNNMTESLYRIWNTGSWLNSFKYNYVYNGNNKLTEAIYNS